MGNLQLLMCRLALAGIILAAFPSQSHAAEMYTGNTMLKACTSDFGGANDPSELAEAAYDAGICAGFIAAGARSNGSTCLPNGVTQEQIKDIFVRYMTNNPAIRHRSGKLILALALSDAFPCR